MGPFFEPSWELYILIHLANGDEQWNKQHSDYVVENPKVHISELLAIALYIHYVEGGPMHWPFI